MKLSDVFQSLSGSKETLEERAERLEKQAIKLEYDDKLRKRIADAEKRIATVKPTGLLGNFGGGMLKGGLVKVIAIGAIIVIIITVVTKAC